MSSPPPPALVDLTREEEVSLKTTSEDLGGELLFGDMTQTSRPRRVLRPGMEVEIVDEWGRDSEHRITSIDARGNVEVVPHRAMTDATRLRVKGDEDEVCYLLAQYHGEVGQTAEHGAAERELAERLRKRARQLKDDHPEFAGMVRDWHKE